MRKDRGEQILASIEQSVINTEKDEVICNLLNITMDELDKIDIQIVEGLRKQVRL